MKHHYLSIFSSLTRKSFIVGLLCVVFSVQWQDASAQSLNISVNDKPLSAVFDIISQQSGYTFVYVDDYLAGVDNVTLQMNGAALNDVLAACLRGTGLWYRIEGKQIVIVSPKIEEPQQPKPPRVITGHVLDLNNEPLVGVTVTVKGTSNGSFTDAEGYFSLEIPGAGATLSFNYFGMEDQEMPVVDETNINVTMLSSASALDEVIVTAYGALQRREDFIGSATQVNAEQLKSLPVTRIDRMLEGLVPGLQINNQAVPNGAQGRDRFSVRIRGDNSLGASGEPLWIIDGVRIYTGDNNNAMSGLQNNVSPLSMINPQDIESMTVLKDATQTSIYGADGSNGIILITTKKGRNGKPEVRASIKYGLSTDDKSTRPKMLNGPQYLMLAKEAWLNSGKNEAAFPWQDNDMNSYSTTDTDWYDEYLRVGQRLQGDISIRSGSDYSSNYISIGYYDENPMLKGNQTQRLSARINSDVNITSKLKLELRLNATYTTDQIFSVGRDFYNTPPILSPYYDGTNKYRLLNKSMTIFRAGEINPYTGETITSGEVYFPLKYRFDNSLPEIDENDVTSRSMSIIGNARLYYDIIEGLRLSSSFGFRHLGSHEFIYKARTNWSGADWDRIDPEDDPTQPIIMLPEGESRPSQANDIGWNNENTVSFDHTFGKHGMGATAILELRGNEHRNVGAVGYEFPNDKMKDVNYASDETRYGSSSTDLSRQLSYAGGVDYNYDRRYYLTGNIRRDGSSLFGNYHQWAKFYSVGASWNIHNEPFFNLPQFSMLKLKGSFGVVGNSRIENVLTNGQYFISSSNGYRGELGGTMGDPPNPGLTWENVYKRDLGISVAVLDDALFFSFEWYNNQTRDLISELPASGLSGSRTMPRNLGILRNTGFEILLTSRNIATENLTWKTTFTLSHNRNKVVELYEEGFKSFFDQGYYQGYEKNVWTNIRWAGVDPRDGAPMWYDTNGNVTRTYNYDNRVKANYSRNPTVYGAISNTWIWKNFEFSMQINYSIGGWGKSSILNYIRDGNSMNTLTGSSNQPVEILDRWQTPGQITSVPILIDGVNRYGITYNDRTMMNMTNFRLSNISVYYDLPPHIVDKLQMQNVAVSFSLDNAYFFSPDQSRTRNSFKTAYDTIAQERIFSMGLELGF
jgi:TonB-linked SusC/RagA family outer membrane protein